MANGTVECKGCGLSDIVRKLHTAIEDSALRSNQPVTFVTASRSRITYQINVRSDGASFGTQDECMKASKAFEDQVVAVFEEYNGKTDFLAKHQCAHQ